MPWPSHSPSSSAPVDHLDLLPPALDQPSDRPPSHDLAPNHDHAGPRAHAVDHVAADTRRRGFGHLPPEVIQRILWMVDANAFASLAIVTRTWYRAAQDKELYAHHLSRCPSYALSNTVITGPFRRNDLLRLKAKFAAEVRRNLFDAYLRPRQTLINLIAVNASSSAALPGAEAFRFAFSPNGRTVLALSSSRIYVISATDDPPRVTKQLKTLRRPLSASVTDDGTVLAVLSSPHQANVYRLDPAGVEHLQVLLMENPPRTIALAPEGTVLAAAYDGGVEVFSLAPTALSTDRRAVRSETVDSLAFSGDGSMLVGSTQTLDEPASVVVTAPFYTENDVPPKEVHSRMWTTQILFPQLSSICSHAELLPSHAEGDANWLFAYDHALMSYRAVRTDDTRTGVAYFLHPTTSRRFSLPAPSTAPTATACGTLVAAAFGPDGLCIYGVPEKLDVSPDMGSVVERHEQRFHGRVPLTSATGHMEPLMAYSPSLSGISDDIEGDSLAAKVDWRESLFVKCQHVRSIDGLTAAKWVENDADQPLAFPGKRLVLVAPGGVDRFAEDLGDERMPVDGSRISVLDFDYAPNAQPDREITIEVGDTDPELLVEQVGDLEVEVAMERRRTVRDRARDGPHALLGRSSTTGAAAHHLLGGRAPGVVRHGLPLQHHAVAQSTGVSPPANLQRSVTASGFQAAKYPPRPPIDSPSPDPTSGAYARAPYQPAPVADGWESPPPPYARTLHDARWTGVLPGPAMVPSRQTSGHMSPVMPGIPESGQVPGPDGRHFQRSPSAPIQAPGHVLSPLVCDTTYRPQTSPAGGGPAAHLIPTYGTPRSADAAPGMTFSASRPDHAPGPTGPNGRHPLPYPVPANLVPAPRRHPGGPPNVLTIPPVRQSPMTPEDAQQSPRHRSRHTPDTPQSSKPSDGKMPGIGGNLHARGHPPVPPMPVTAPQTPASPWASAVPDALGGAPDADARAGAGASPVVAPKTAATAVGGPAPYTVAAPTVDQLANLQRRVSSQTTRKPVANIHTNGVRQDPSAPSHGGDRDAAVPPSPPRGAWGAAGLPGSPTFNKAIQLPNGLARNHSLGNGRSIPFSSSMPNLPSTAATPAPRPPLDRLETIHSVASSYGPGEPGPRYAPLVTSSTVATDVPPPQPVERFYSGQLSAIGSPLHAPHTYHPTATEGNGEYGSPGTQVPDPTLKKKKGKWKRGHRGLDRRKSVLRTHGASVGTGTGTDTGAQKKENGSKCLVM